MDYLKSLVVSMYILVTSNIAMKVNQIVPDPYMDEVFHIPQAQKYCNYNFSFWDPKITTPPGLYVASLAILKPMQSMLEFPQESTCSTFSLRAINIGLSTLLLLTFWQLLKVIHPTTSSFRLLLNALVMSLFPVLYFFNFLYYTDVGSVLCVFLVYWAALGGYHWTGGLVSLLAVLFRQPNIVWVAFAAGVSLFRKLHEVSENKNDQDFLNDKTIIEIANVDEMGTLFLDALRIFYKRSHEIVKYLPYILVGIAFLSFVYINGGIALGDKEHHIVVFHFPQILYFLGFTGYFFVPLFTPNDFEITTGWLRSIVTSTTSITWMGVVALILGVLVQKYTYAHPFLLSDNRHYIFYVWKNIFRTNPLAKFLVCPAYIFTGKYIIVKLAKQSVFWCLLYIAATFISLVSSPLIEFRYYIIPYFVLRLHIQVPSYPRLMFEALFYLIVNYITLWIFLYHPFQWPSEPDVWQRFMW